MAAFVARRELLLGLAATAPGIAHRRRRDVSFASGPHPGRDLRRRRHRPRRALHRAMADRAARAILLRREPARWRQQHRHRDGGAFAAGRLYIVHGEHGQYHQQFALSKLNYNFIADFAPVANVMGTPLLVLVHPSVAAKNAAELIALAKAAPGKLNLASGGVGSTGHMSAELFQMMAGIKFTHVPYRGEAPALTDLIAGQAQLMVSTTGSSLQYAKAGTVRALATTTDDRVAELPDVPPLSKTVPGYRANAWSGLCAPKGTPRGDHRLAQQGGEPRDGRSEDQGAHRQPRRCRAARVAGGLRRNDRGRHREVGQGRAVLRRARELNATCSEASSSSSSVRASRGSRPVPRMQGRDHATTPSDPLSTRSLVARGLYIENDLAFRRFQSAFQHHVRVSRIR